METPAPRVLRLVPPAPPETTRGAVDDDQHLDAYRVEVWVSTQDTMPWLASSAIVDSFPAARAHATGTVAGLLTDGIDPDDIFVGAIRGQVPAVRAHALDPGWVPVQREPVGVSVIDDTGDLGLWVFEPPHRWQARTRLASPPQPHTPGAPQQPGEAVTR